MWGLNSVTVLNHVYGTRDAKLAKKVDFTRCQSRVLPGARILRVVLVVKLIWLRVVQIKEGYRTKTMDKY